MAIQAYVPELLAPRAPARPRLRSLAPHVLLVANANASGLTRRPELVDGSARLLRDAGARVETRLTATLEELADALAAAERRVVLLGGGFLGVAASTQLVAVAVALAAGAAGFGLASTLGFPLFSALIPDGPWRSRRLSRSRSASSSRACASCSGATSPPSRSHGSSSARTSRATSSPGRLLGLRARCSWPARSTGCGRGPRPRRTPARTRRRRSCRRAWPR